MKFSPSTSLFYSPSLHKNLPADCIDVTAAEYQRLLNGRAAGQLIEIDKSGKPQLVDPPPVLLTVDQLCARIDAAADTARRAVAGDPMRAVEYDRTRMQAEQFAAAGYQGEVPPMVAAWVTSERDAQAAADDILREAALYEEALVQVRTIRLQAKEQIRAMMAAADVDQAAQLTEQTTADLAACVQGVGNA